MTIKFNTKRNVETLKKVMGEDIKKWYMKEYPTDDLGEDLTDGATFYDLFEALKEEVDVYSLIGIGDSLIRERLFLELATIMNVDYEVIYQQWLGKPKYSFYRNAA